MEREKVSLTFPPWRGRHNENGIALVTTLLLLMLLSGMVVAMVMTTNSDMLINGYYRDFRGGYYAADSGLAIVRQSIANQILATVPATFPPQTQPIQPNTEVTVLANIKATYGLSYTSINSGQDSSWPAKFELDQNQTSITAAGCSVFGGAPGATCINTCPSGCLTAATIPEHLTYTYTYHLLVYGRASGPQKTTLEETGSLKLTVPLTAAGNTSKSFAAWGMFIDAGTICDGSHLVPGTISGPVFTNGAWNFYSPGQYIFTDTVGSHSPKAGYQFDSGCDQSNGVSDTKNGTTIAPSFTNPPKWGQNTVPLPKNDYNQQRAVLDGVGTAGQPSNGDRASVLRTAKPSTTYPSLGMAKNQTGVFLPYSVTAGVATFTGGGILVAGDASVTLSTSGTSTQIYSIKQGTLTTTITINNPYSTNFKDTSGNDVTINGVPEQRDPVTSSVISPATMLYVDGNITSLSGTGPGAAAIQDGTALTITASGNIAITGDILYKTEPVTLTQGQIVGAPADTPADTLIPGNDKGQALGIFTATGDIQLKNSQTSGDLQIDASLATISQSGTGGLINLGNSINKLTIVGGRIQNQMKNINATTRNVYFDRRYANGVAPPWFPSTSINNFGDVSGNTSSSKFQRLQWVNRTAFQ